jgi:PKD repeat protein
VAGFSGTPTNGFAPLSVTFTDASTGSITNWVWTFGDGSSVTNPTSASQGHTYAVGTNTVNLVVNGPGGSSTNTRAGYIAAVSAKVVFSSSSNPSSFGSGKFGFSGTGGPAGVQYRVLTQTNVAQPLANWTPIYTNTFKSDGSYAYTNSTLIGNQGYLILVSP